MQIKGKIGILFLITLIIGAITFAVTAVLSRIPYVGTLLASLLIAPFSVSTVHVYQAVCRYEMPEVKDVFYGFEDYWSAFKVNFFTGLFTFLWSLLFIIPGIIKTLSYSMSFYILEENRGMGALECIDRSKAMMNGHKMEFFVFGLSFLGWILLGCITFGIAYIWVIPYLNAATTNFYNNLKASEAVERAVPAAEEEAE